MIARCPDCYRPLRDPVHICPVTHNHKPKPKKRKPQVRARPNRPTRAEYLESVRVTPERKAELARARQARYKERKRKERGG